jgi:hypothetical protein
VWNKQEISARWDCDRRADCLLSQDVPVDADVQCGKAAMCPGTRKKGHSVFY